MKPLTIQRLKSLVCFDADSGVFVRAIQTGRHGRYKAGSITGCICIDGYTRLKVDGVSYLAHRLAWFYMRGEWPEQIDHIDGNKSNNSFSNLRNVTPSVNKQNRKKAQADNALGILGVTPFKGKFHANIKINGRATYLGRFKTASEAHTKYVEAKRTFHVGNTL